MPYTIIHTVKLQDTAKDEARLAAARALYAELLKYLERGRENDGDIRAAER
ncbi:MAG: hypothetical protein K2N38_14995 [Oscillospiraceae bacterium]|nr:hypothetical protein [Oscillospiraceae bacterium]